MSFLMRCLMRCLLRCLLPGVLGVAVHFSALADQRSEELPGLFTQLEQSTSADDTRTLEAKIWQLWLQAPDENSSLLLSQISRAMGTGELDLALSLADQLVDSSGDFAEAWNKRATIHYLMGNHAESVADIRETLALEPRHFGAISGLGLIFLRERNLQAALEAFEQVLAISPSSENARLSIERVRAELEREI